MKSRRPENPASKGKMSQGINKPRRSAVFKDLGLLEYGRALEIQQQTLAAKIDNPLIEDHLLFVEHPSVFTLGKRGGRENLGVSQEFLRSKGIEVVQTDRGGNITYHGPGQAVFYPIVDLEKNKIGVKEFVHGLEEIMKQTATDFSVHADRDPRNHGIWVNDSKIGSSVGISIRRGISFHGLALNVNIDLEPFSWINPCGLENVCMTSLKRELKKEKDLGSTQLIPDPIIYPSLNQIKQAFITHFSSIFNYSVK